MVNATTTIASAGNSTEVDTAIKTIDDAKWLGTITVGAVVIIVHKV